MCDCEPVAIASFFGGMVAMILFILWYGGRGPRK